MKTKHVILIVSGIAITYIGYRAYKHNSKPQIQESVIVKLGDKGYEVKRLKAFLNLSYGTNLTPESVYDKKTHKIVKRNMENHEAVRDINAGAVDLNKLKLF